MFLGRVVTRPAPFIRVTRVNSPQREKGLRLTNNKSNYKPPKKSAPRLLLIDPVSSAFCSVLTSITESSPLPPGQNGSCDVYQMAWVLYNFAHENAQIQNKIWAGKKERKFNYDFRSIGRYSL